MAKLEVGTWSVGGNLLLYHRIANAHTLCPCNSIGGIFPAHTLPNCEMMYVQGFHSRTICKSQRLKTFSMYQWDTESLNYDILTVEHYEALEK